MSIDDLFLLLLTNLFRVYIIRRFIGIFFQIESLNKKKTLIAFGVFYISTTAVFLLFAAPPYNIFVNIIGIYALISLYSGKTKKKIIVSALIYIVNMVCDIIASFLFFEYKYMDKFTDQTFSIVTDLLILICSIVVERIMLEEGKKDKLSPYISGLIVIPVISIIMEFFLLSSNLNNRVLIEIESFGILIINMLIFYFYFCIQESYQLKMDEEILVRQVDMYRNQLEVIKESEEKVYGLKHDLKHHIAELKMLAQKNHEEDINNYLLEMSNYLENTNCFVLSGNKEIDSLLNYMLGKAKDILNCVNVNIKIPDSLNIHSFDMNIVLGNILENAIEAAKESDKKILEVNIRTDSGLLFINIKNSYKGEIRTVGKYLISTKQEKGKHGIGLKNVIEVIEKNNGLIDITYEKNIFTVDIMIYLSRVL